MVTVVIVTMKHTLKKGVRGRGGMGREMHVNLVLFCCNRAFLDRALVVFLLVHLIGGLFSLSISGPS